MSKETVKNLEALRSEMQRLRVDAVIIPGTDPHQSEYVSDHWKLRDWVSGFTGSNGTAVVTADSAGLWTDSRYFLQASQQLQDSGFDMHKEDVPGEESINEWIATHLPDGAILAVDGYLFSITQAAGKIRRRKRTKQNRTHTRRGGKSRSRLHFHSVAR